jgi:hypothetical protein
MPCVDCAHCGYDLRPNRTTPYFCIKAREKHSGDYHCQYFDRLEDGVPYAEVISVYNEREG